MNCGECHVISQIIVLVGVGELGDTVRTDLKRVVSEDRFRPFKVSTKDALLMPFDGLFRFIFEELVEWFLAAAESI
jgi:hypothetical protein